MSVHVFRGDPKQIGSEYGRDLADQIRRNLSILVYRDGYEPLPRQDADFIAWIRNQESLIAQNWPWLLDEMSAVAGVVGADIEDVLLLNLRAWQYEYYGARPMVHCCSSLAVTLADGTVACAGALDDCIDYYRGPVKFLPSDGYGFVTFPLSGTSWASRSMNSQGLSLGVSSQILPGLKHSDDAINQDLALRIISQTCATVDEVREFCRAHPFTVNLVCVDANGGIFCAQNTTAGLLEIPATEGYCALTNHVAVDEHEEWLRQQGVAEFRAEGNSRQRREKLLSFAGERNGKCGAEEVLELISARDDDDPGTIHNKGTIYLTFANPRVDAGTLWVMQPSDSTNNGGFEAISIGGEYEK